MKKFFIILGVIGEIVICRLAFVIPKNPFERFITLTMGINAPMWLYFIVGWSIIYLLILLTFYDRLNISINR